MLEAMRHLSLLYLQEYLGLDSDYSLRQIRDSYPGELNSLLVESSEKIKRVYVLSKVNSDTAKMSAIELTPEHLKRLPFNKPSGSQSPAIGPVIKRTFADKKIGPTKRIQDTTLSYFFELSKDSSTVWSNYFAEVLEVLYLKQLVYDGQTIVLGKDNSFSTILEASVSLIPDRETVFITVADKEGRWPGDRKDYWDYLSSILAQEKYLTGDTPIVDNQTCPLCATQNTKLYPNGVKGAGLNLYNMDREGCFINQDRTLAWKSFALCLDCADLLYIFKNHLMPKFITRIAGDKCFVLADLTLVSKSKQKEIVGKLKKFLIDAPSQTLPSSEIDVLALLKDDNEVSNFSLQIIWAKFGQALDDLTGVISEVLPSRLSFLSYLNQEMNSLEHPLAPTNNIPSLEFDINLNFFYPLFERPGGKKVDALNNSVRLFEVKRALASAIYREEQLPNTYLEVILKEVIETARCYLNQAMESNSWTFLLDETPSNSKNNKYVTLASWIKHLYRFLKYLANLEVYTVPQQQVIEVQMKTLQPYFTPDSGVNSLEKAFAFLLGILFGKVVLVQGARGVNLQSNALTWLKRLNLTGKDLPELYIKIREKLLAYETSNNPDVQALEKEIAKIALKLGSDIKLSNIDTCYFLLLGQSVSRSVLPTKRDKEEINELETVNS